jgi:hypothetical protein
VTQPSEYAIRKARLIKCNSDPELQALAIAACKRDIILWLNDWVWTQDPRRAPAMLPFRPWPRQVEYLRWRQSMRELVREGGQPESGLIEKSRDMGITWLNAAAQTHAWLFERNYKGAFGSRKQDLVDRLGDPDSIFEKVRIILRYLPKWMLPEGFDDRRHDNFCKLINPANGSVLTGEAGDNIGRGGRNTVYDLDEAAFIDRPQKVDAALSNNTDLIFYTSTVNGVGNPFHQKRFNLQENCIFVFDWRDDPRKDDAWYESMCRRFDPVVVATEIDRDYGASVEGIFIPAKWVAAAVNFAGCEAWGDRTAGLDVATSGKNRSVLVWRIGPVVQVPIDWQGQNTTETAFRAHDICVDNRIGHINFDADGVGAGVSGAYESAQDLQITYKAIHGAARASDRIWPGELRTSADKFANVRAEAWGLLRERFRKTYDHVNGIQTHDWREMISIPNHPLLIQQLSSVQGKHTTSGKILLQSKEDMRKDGIESPDFADALAYSELGGAASSDFMSSGARAGLRRK